MTAIAGYTNGWYPEGMGTQLPAGANVPNQANANAGQGQLMTFDASGNAALNDGTAPGLLGAGVAFPGKLSDANVTAAATRTAMWWGFGGMPFSTAAGDSFTNADVGVVAFIATENTIGKKRNSRSIAGLVFGLNDDGFARFWGGPVACRIAESILSALAFPLASHGIADAAASTAVAERAINRSKVGGVVTSIVFNGAAVAADNTDYDTITIAKRDGAGGGAVTLGTYDTRAANNGAITAFVDAPFTLSVVAGALNILETDVITITTVKAGAGKVLTGQFLVNGKAI